MIYFIGGAPRVGKSIFGKKIAEAAQVSFVSTDDLCEKVSSALPEEERKSKFPMPSFSGDASENVLLPDELVRRLVISAQSVEPEIDALISVGIANNQSFVIEGVHLLPEHVSVLQERYGSEKIRSMFIGLGDVDEVVQGIVKNVSPDNWMRNSNPDVIRQVAEFVAAFSRYIKEESKKYHLPYKERTEDFEGDMNRLGEQLLSDSEIKLPLK